MCHPRKTIPVAVKKGRRLCFSYAFESLRVNPLKCTRSFMVGRVSSYGGGEGEFRILDDLLFFSRRTFIILLLHIYLFFIVMVLLVATNLIKSSQRC